MIVDQKRIVEGLLFVADSPLSLEQMASALETGDQAALKTLLAELRDEYETAGRAFVLVEKAGGYYFRTRPELSFWLRRLRREQVTRLSRAALETLAIIAYKQPIMKAEIERLRGGVDAGGVLRLLMEKDLARALGRRDLPGRPLVYGTTKRFLETFDLQAISDLPSLEEIAALSAGLEGAAGMEQPRLPLGEPLKEAAAGAEETLELWEDDSELTRFAFQGRSLSPEEQEDSARTEPAEVLPESAAAPDADPPAEDA